MTEEIIDCPGFRVGEERFGTRAKAEDYVREQSWRHQAERFAEWHLSDEVDRSPSQRSISRVANLVVAYKEWERAQALTAEVNP